MMVHIVPAVPPAVNGLGDYVFQLWQNWPAPRPNWGCLSARLDADSAQKWPEIALSGFERSADSLQFQLEKWPVETLVLHYVGYAYDRNGVPAWLPGALAQWKKRHSSARLVVMFHEVWAPGPFWRKHFWFLARAKAIVRGLLAIGDLWITSCDDYERRLLSVGADAKKGLILPVASNIEPAQTVDFSKNWPLQNGGKLKIAVFGQENTRLTALQRHKNLLKILVEREMIEEITILGRAPRVDAVKSQMNALQKQIAPLEIWKTAYDLENAALSQILATHNAGLVKDASIRAGKSGVFAALCAHGVTPICVGEIPDFEDGGEADKAHPFLLNADKMPALCAELLNSFDTVSRARGEVETLATTVLSWPHVARAWATHIS